MLGFAAVNAAVIGWVVSQNWTYPGGSIEKDVLSDNLKSSPSYGTWTWWAARGYFKEPKTPDVVLMGSSLVNSACWSADAVTTKTPIDCALHHRVITLENQLKEKLQNGAAPNVVNVSVQGAGACDYYMMTRVLMEGTRKPKILVLGVAPRDFIDNKVHSLGDTEPFMFYQRYVNFDSTVARAYSNPWQRAMGELDWRVGRLPLRRFHSAVAPYLTDDSSAEKPRADAANQLRHALCNGSLHIYPGDIVVPATVTEGCFDNTSEYASRYKNPHPAHFKTQLFFFEQMLKRMQEENIKVVVVDMPALAKNRFMLPMSFWKNYLAEMQTLCGKYGAQYVSLTASPDYVVKDFVDNVHVNWRGGAKVLNRIASEIAGTPKLAETLSSAPAQKMISSKKVEITD